MTLYYLAGPMTGLPEYNFAEFDRVVAELRDNGFEVLSSHEIDHGETPETRGSKPHGDYVREDLKHLLVCDAIILLPGWELSRGCQVEVKVAQAIGIQMHKYCGCSDIIHKLEAPRNGWL